MQRVAILGSPGAGKSTLARQLAATSGLPLVHLDQLFWQAGWVERDKAEWRAAQTAAVAEPQWIIDGNYGGTMDERLAAADTLVFLDISPLTCAMRLLRRAQRYAGSARPDVPQGCPERLSPALVLYALRFGANKRPGILRRSSEFAGQVHHLRSDADVATFLATAARSDHRPGLQIQEEPI